VGVPERFAIHPSRYVRSFQGIPPSGRLPDDLAREIRHAYFACVSYIDSLVGGILDTLEETGAAEDTIILFWSDHGYHLGDHSLWSKHTNFERSTRVPLIASVPGAVETGVDCEALVELVDVYPTLVEWCGLPLPDHLEGRSFAQRLADPDGAGRPAAFSEFSRGGARGVSVRSPQFRYTEWRKGDAVVARELYDHHRDPLETRNEAENPEYAEAMRELARLLAVRLGEGGPR